MLSFYIFCSFIAYALMENCPMQYKCLDDKTDLNICAKKNTTTTIPTYYVRVCPNGKVCPKAQLATKDVISCEDKNEEEATKGQDGEDCKTNDDCYSNKCSNKKCKGKEDGEECSDDNECSMVSYCSKNSTESRGICIHIKNVTVPCEEDKECNITAICSKNETFKDKSVCLYIHDTPAGSWVEDQRLCVSNRMDSEHICYETYPRNLPNEKNNITEGAECEKDDDCPIYIDYGNGTIKNTTGKCLCSYTGKKYCEYTSQSKTRYIKYLRLIKEIREKFENDTIVRDARENYWDSWDVHKYVMKNDILYRNLPDCVFDYFVETGNYISLSLIVSLLSIILIF